MATTSVMRKLGHGISNSQPELTEKTLVPIADQGMDVLPNDGMHRGSFQKEGAPLDENGNPTMKVYDNGGPVDIHDGLHQMAILKAGEKVLTPEEAAAYDAQHGAPTNFGGPVLSNPNGLKPMLDTEIPPAHEPEKVMGNGKMNADNAPLKTPAGNINNAELGNPAMSPLGKQPKEADPHVTDAASKEYGMGQPDEAPRGTESERKAIEVDKQKAMGSGNLVKLGTALLNERHLSPVRMKPIHMDVDTGKPSSSLPPLVEYPKPQPSLPLYDNGGTVRLKPMQLTEDQAALTTGGPTTASADMKVYDDGGDVSVNPKDVYKDKPTPEEFNQGSNKGASLPGSVDQYTQPMRNLGQTEPKEQSAQSSTQQTAQQPVATPSEPTLKERVDSATDHGSKLKAFDSYISEKLQDVDNPESKEKADRAALAKQVFQKNTPWGSESNHPGFMGKLGHIAAKVGNIGLDVIAPKTAELIPGTDLNKRVQEGTTERNIAADVAAEAKANKTGEPSWKEITGGAVDPAHPEHGMQQAFFNEKDPGQRKFAGPVPDKGKEGAVAAESDINDYKQRIANSGLTGPALQVYGSAPAGATKAELDKRFDEATKLRGMDQKDAETQIQNQMRQDAVDEKKKNKYYTYTDEKGTHMVTGDKLDSLPPDTEYTTVKDPAQLTGEGRAMNAVQDSLNDLHKDLEQHPEVFDSAAARSIVQTTTEQMNRAAAGLLIAGTGGQIPLPSGMGDMINTALQNNALDDKTAKAVKDYIADYKAMKDKAMVIQMMMQNGKMGRGGMQAFESIVNQLPGGSTPDSATALRQMSALQRTTSGLLGKYPEGYGDYKKSKPYEGKTKEKATTEAGTQPNAEHQKFVQSIVLPGGGHPADAAKGPNGDTIIWSGKAGDPWTDLTTGKPVQ